MGRFSQETRAILYMSQYFDKIGNTHREREKKKTTLTANHVVVWKKNNNLGKENVNCALEGEIQVRAWIEEKGFRRSVNKLL